MYAFYQFKSTPFLEAMALFVTSRLCEELYRLSLVSRHLISTAQSSGATRSSRGPALGCTPSTSASTTTRVAPLFHSQRPPTQPPQALRILQTCIKAG